MTSPNQNNSITCEDCRPETNTEKQCTKEEETLSWDPAER